MSHHTPADDIKRAAAVSLALTGGAVAALAVAAYLSKQQGRGLGKIPLGGVNAASVDSWLRNAAEKMQTGSQTILSDFDKRR